MDATRSQQLADLGLEGEEGMSDLSPMSPSPYLSAAAAAKTAAGAGPRTGSRALQKDSDFDDSEPPAKPAGRGAGFFF